MKKLFFDTEFTGLHQNTTLISLGILAETGQSFYAEFNDFDKSQINDWIQKEVISRLLYKDRVLLPESEKHNGGVSTDDIKFFMENAKIWGNSQYIIKSLNEWLSQFDKIEWWSDCLAYDWVLLCQLYNGALNIPDKFYYIPFDICTLFKQKGIDPDISREGFLKENGNEWFKNQEHHQKHNALWDAIIIKNCYDILQKREEVCMKLTQKSAIDT